MKYHKWVHTSKHDFDFDGLNLSGLIHSYAYVCSVCHVRIHTTDGNPPTPEPSDQRYFWDCDLFILHGVHDD